MTDPKAQGFTPGLDGLQLGGNARGRVMSLIEFRAGDGPMIQIHPDYQLQLERAPQSVVVSWQEDGQPMNAAIPVVEFDQFVQAGQIVVER
ncbi:hypothetical protein [Ottowia testudinis]|uniref:Uncharacterized protein n=1 Tax=Ottowia testudinis TaxID=2816950 RepID=A0A975CDI2_9BURK|nr:hypothetical protein [Ottowia testudinis]QTD44260.1 hypothetical protein J1M35_14185 [Ottowia testudinis]